MSREIQKYGIIEFLSLRYNTFGVKIDTSNIKFSESSALAWIGLCNLYFAKFFIL